VEGFLQELDGLVEGLAEGLDQRLEAGGASDRDHRAGHPHPAEERGHVAGDRGEVASEERVGGAVLVAEVGHLALGEDRAPGGDRDRVGGVDGQAVGLLDVEAEAAGRS
jgi:hypothetical protein